jgi:BolA family transcriptional regulator, general stress-responsive regulator
VSQFESRMQSLAPQVLDVRDDSSHHAGHAGNNGGGHLSAKIIATAFSGKTTVQRHRIVYALVNDLMPHTIHALSLTTQTPDEAMQAFDN